MEQQEIQDAAEALYRRYYAAMKGRAMRYVNDPADAEDVVSSCWLSLMRHIPKLMAMQDRVLSAYILLSVEHRALDLIKQRQRMREYMTGLREEVRAQGSGPAGLGGDPAVMAEKRDTLRQVMTALPENQRRVVQLRLQGWTPEEIAAEMHISPSAVRSCWRRALVHLRRGLRA